MNNIGNGIPKKEYSNKNQSKVPGLYEAGQSKKLQKRLEEECKKST